MIKRTFDILISLISLIVLSPVFLVLFIMVYVKIGAPAIFMQERPGLKGRPFTMYKFRTMTNARDTEGNLLSNDMRMTKFGGLLRRTSLDELPELFNVLKGEMSLVGPRPLLKDYLPLYNEFQYRRHEVRPGITGWAQVNGRNAIDWDTKFNYDVWYVDHQNFFLDIKILLMTFLKVVKREGISHGNDVAMPRFTGND